MSISYTFKVYPKGYARTIYRTIEISGNETLNRLCYGILSSFDFDWDHLFEVCMNNKPYSRGFAYQSHPDAGEPSTDVLLQEMGLYKGQNFLFHYDFGDDWMFTVHVQKVELKEGPPYPSVIASKGELQQYPDWDDEEYEDEEDVEGEEDDEEEEDDDNNEEEDEEEEK